MGKPTHYSVGSGRWPIVVIDDFHEAPMSLVERAGDMSKFESHQNDFYPGVKQVANNEQCAKNFQRYTDTLSRVFGELGELQDSTYAIANCPPNDLLPIQRIPHYDTANPQQLALVHYLCSPNLGGTAFYRHRSTNIERISVENEKAYQTALGREATTHGLPPAEYVNGDTDLFEKIGMIDASFNRVVIYPASLLHTGAIQWQSTNHQMETSSLDGVRLTITAHVGPVG